MIVRFDSLNRYEKPIFHLCNPGCALTDGVLTNTIGMLTDTSDEEIVFSFNSTSTLSLRVYYRADCDSDEENAYIKSIFDCVQNSRLIYIDDIGFFVITSAEYSFEDGIEYKDVEASSCDIEMQNKNIPYIADGTYQFRELLTKVIASTPMWSIAHIDDNLQSNIDKTPSGTDERYWKAKFEAERCEYLIEIYTRVLANVENSEEYKDAIEEYHGDEIPATEDLETLTAFLTNEIAKYNTLLQTQKDIVAEYTVDTPVLCDTKAYRTFEDVDTDTNVLSFMLENMQEAYECIFIFDIINRQIYAYDQDNYINETDIHITKDDLIQSLTISENSDDLYTAISCTGDDDDVNISAVNPIGGNTIYRFDYYLSWMTSSLFTKVNEWQNLVAYYGNDDGETPAADDYSSIGALYAKQLAEYYDKTNEVSRLGYLIEKYQSCYDNIVVDIDAAKKYDTVIGDYGGRTGDITGYALSDSGTKVPTTFSEDVPTVEEGKYLWFRIEIDEAIEYYSVLIDDTNAVNPADVIALQKFVKHEMETAEADKATAQTAATAADTKAKEYKASMDAINGTLAITSYFTASEYAELSNYILEGQYTDDYITVTDTMTIDEKYSQYKQLYRRAKKEILAISEPTQEFSVDVENFVFSKDFSHFTSELATGVLINVELSEDDVAELVLTELTINYDDMDMSMTFGNRLNRYDPKALFNDVLGDVKKSANSVEYLNTIVYPVKKGVISVIQQELSDSRNITKEAALAATDQSVVIDDTGYTGKKITEDGTDPKQIKIANNSIVFTEDSWDTASVAIGEIKLSDGSSTYGINAKTIFGDLLTNAQTRIIIDNDSGDPYYLTDLPEDMEETKSTAEGAASEASAASSAASAASSAASAASSAASAAASAASSAQTTANQAKTLANGKNMVYYSPTKPTTPAVGDSFVDGDVWFDTSTSSEETAKAATDGAIAHQMWIYSTKESGWVLHQLGTYSIAEGAIIGDRVAANTITADNIAAGTITTNEISSDVLTTGVIKVTGSSDTLDTRLDEIDSSILRTGRNYIIYSGDRKKWILNATSNTSVSYLTDTDGSTYGQIQYKPTASGSSASATRTIYDDSNNYLALPETVLAGGKQYTFSLYVKTNGWSPVKNDEKFLIGWLAQTDEGLIRRAYITVYLNTTDGTVDYSNWTKVYATGYIPVLTDTTGVRIRFDTSASSTFSNPGNIIWYKNFKLETGNTATEWSAAPEDMVSSYITYYAKSTDSSSAPTGYGTYPPTGSWSTNAPTWENGSYIWSITYTIHADGKYDTGNPVNITGAKGTSGSSAYTYVRYSANASGADFDEDPEGKPYIGVYTGDSSTAPTSASAYTWSKYVGDNGNDGNGINSITYYYLASTSSTKPDYDKITDTDINNQKISAEKKYLWQKEVIDFTDESLQDKTTVLLLAVYGDTGDQGTHGYNTATVYLFKRGSTKPSVPTGTLTYTFSSKSLSGDLDDWSTSVPATNGNPCYVTMATAVSVGDTDSLSEDDWMPPVVIYTDGKDGTNAISAYLTNEAQTFVYGTATTITTQLCAFSGTTSATVTIKTVNGKTASTSTTATGLTGMNFKVSSTSAATSPTISFISTTSLAQSQTEQVPIVYRVTGDTADRTIYFSYSSTTRGATGSTGTSSYTHIRYSAYSDGTSFDTDPSGKTYIGVYTGTSSTAPTEKTSYTWSKYVGNDGANGSDGNGINSITYYYLASTSSTAPDASSITDTNINNQTISSSKKYLWQKEVIDFTDSSVEDKTTVVLLAVYGDTGTNGTDGTNGKDGTSVTISSTAVTYQASSSGTTIPTGTWSTSVPTVSNGQYLWTKTVVNYSPSGSTTSYAVAYKGTNGTNGTNGTSASLVDIAATSQTFKSTDGGTTYTPDTITLTPRFQTVTYSKWQYSTNGGTSWSDATSGSNGLTITSAGVLTIAKSSDLYTSVSAVVFKCVSSTATVYDTMTVIKISDGVDGKDGTNAISAYLTNEAQTFAAKTKATVTTKLCVYSGTTSQKVTIASVDGITATTTMTATSHTGMSFKVSSTGSVTTPTITFEANENLPESITAQLAIVYTIGTDTTQYTANFSYSTTTTGAAGTSASLVDINASSQTFKSVDGGTTYTPDTITLTPIFQNVTYSKWQYSVNGGSTWTNAASGSKGITITDGVLQLAKDSSLFTSSVTSIVFKCISSVSTVFDTMTVVRIADGVNGVDGSTIWTTSVAPTADTSAQSYTFNISNLSGTAGSTPKVNDVVLYSYYKYTISSVATSTVVGTNRINMKGETGEKGDQGVGISEMTELYYCSGSSTAPSAPKSGPVTVDSSTVYGAWNLTCPTYSSNYPYYYTCQQILYTTGAYGFSGVTSNNGYRDANATADAANTTANTALSTGRNYIIYSGDRSRWYLSSASYCASSTDDDIGIITSTSETSGNAASAYRYLCRESSSSCYIAMPDTLLSGGNTYTFSLYVKTNGWKPTGTEYFNFSWWNSAGTASTRIDLYLDSSLDYSDWVRISVTQYIENLTDRTGIRVCLNVPATSSFGDTVGNALYYKNFKLETGSVATDWCISQEEEVSGYVAYYAKSSSSTTIPTGYSTYPPTGSWSKTTPTWEDGTYIWSVTYTIHVDKSYDVGTPVNITGATGATGQTGDTGTSVLETIPLYYCSNNNTTPDAPTSAVTSTSTSTLQWTTVMPAFTKTYCYIYTCDQTKYSTNEYSWSAVTLDRSVSAVAGWCSAEDVTYIDGSNIYTGSISAEQISAGSITLTSKLSDIENTALTTGKNYIIYSADRTKWIIGKATNTDVGYDTEEDGSTFGYISYKNSTLNQSAYAHRFIYSESSKIYFLSSPSTVLAGGTQFTFSLYVKLVNKSTGSAWSANSAYDYIILSWRDASNSRLDTMTIGLNGAGYGDWTRVSVTKQMGSITGATQLRIRFYFQSGSNFGADANNMVYYKNFKLETGSTATDWCTAQEDVYYNNTTKIDGGNIYTGSVTTDKIKLGGMLDVYSDTNYTTVGGSLGYKSGVNWGGDTTNGIAIKSAANTDSGGYGYVIATTSGARMTQYDGTSTEYSIYVADGVGNCNTRFAAPVLTSYIHHYMTYSCDTAQDTAIKEVVADNGVAYTGSQGLVIKVKFTYANTVVSSDVYLHIKNGNNYWFGGENVAVKRKNGSFRNISWLAGEVVTFTYVDGYMVMDDTSVYSPICLWTNDSPSSSFSAKNITISGVCNHLEICCAWSTDYTTSVFNTSLYVPDVSSSMTALLAVPWYGSSVAYPAMTQRNATFTRSSNQVSFGAGRHVVSGSTASSNNNCCIPLYIIGKVI